MTHDIDVSKYETSHQVKNTELAPPIKGLIRIIARAVVEDYRQEILEKLPQKSGDRSQNEAP